ncbi:ABC transporter substrate-binding protein [Catellatospora citrea]|uniref:ABC transporter substrate-binding protein n=1 Tax=Catellatospora citrea TaxID=53366 RepID=UPI0033E2C52A
MRTPRRTMLSALAATAVLAVTGCTGSAMENQTSTPAKTLTIGFLAPQTGPLAAIGKDMLAGWNLYLDQHGGKLGGHQVKLVVADEGDGGPATRAAVDKFIKADKVTAIVGAASAPAVSTTAGPATEAQIPFVGVGGRPSSLSDLRYIWHTSFASVDYGKAVGAHLAKTADGPVYVIGPDYPGGHDQIGGFVQAFTAAGGKIANPGGKPVYTPYPATSNFAPWLTKIKDSGAKAVYAFYAGANSVDFVRQYRQLVDGALPLYGPAFLTEGAALPAQKDAADKVFTVANYCACIDNPANIAFAAAIRGRAGSEPNVYHMTSFDGAALLDKAIAAASAAGAGTPTPQAINEAIAALGALDSPRGSWRIDATTHTPVQGWYLRQVTADNGAYTNKIVATLATAS